MHIAEPLTRFVMEFKPDLISIQEIEELRYHLHSRGVLNPDEMDILTHLNQPTSSNRYEQVYHLLHILDQKPNGPVQLIDVLLEAASEQNHLGEIASTLMAEYSKLWLCMIYNTWQKAMVLKLGWILNAIL